QLYRLMARMDSVFACNDQSPANRNDWRELKHHIVRMRDGLTLVHVTLREERERGISLTAETARKLEGWARWGRYPPEPVNAAAVGSYSTTPASDLEKNLEKSSCTNVGSPLRGGALLIGCDWGERQSRRGLAAEPSVTMAALISSSTVDSELRWLSTSRITSLYVTS